jgi:hypothetical protein
VGESPPGFTMNSIYFNHIPRTGGTTLSRMLQNSGINKCGLNIFSPQTSNYLGKEFNESNICQSNLVMGHYGIAPSIFNSDIDTVTFLRNPVDQVVSMFAKLNNESKDLDKKAKVFEVFRSSKYKEDPISLFREWLYDERSTEYTNNGQIYNLINTRYPYMYDPVTKEKIDKETEIVVTEENAKEKMQSLLFVGKTENLYDGYSKIIDIINERFGTSLSKLQRAGVYNGINQTKDVVKTLTESEISYILDKNSIDRYYWESVNIDPTNPKNFM